jgi:hypothetical protein
MAGWRFLIAARPARGRGGRNDQWTTLLSPRSSRLLIARRVTALGLILFGVLLPRLLPRLLLRLLLLAGRLLLRLLRLLLFLFVGCGRRAAPSTTTFAALIFGRRLPVARIRWIVCHALFTSS